MASELVIMGFVLAFGFLVYAIYFSSVLRPRTVRSKIASVPNFSANEEEIHIGNRGALAFDMSQRNLVYCDWAQPDHFSVSEPIIIAGSDLVDGRYHFGEVQDSYGKISSDKFWVLITTNDRRKPKIDLAFRTENQALQCEVTLRMFKRTLSDFMSTTDSGEEGKVTLPTTDSLPSTDITVPQHLKISNYEQKFVNQLTEFLGARGFSRADGENEVSSVRIVDAIKEFPGNLEDIWGRPGPKDSRWRKIVTTSLYPFFVARPGDPANFGFTPSTLYRYVTMYWKKRVEL